LLSDTLILFTSDHGELLGDHKSFSKVSGYEPSIRVPLIVAGPGLEGQGALSDEWVTLYDVAPTLYGFAGVAPPAGTRLLGQSLFSERDAIRRRDRVFFEMGTGDGPASFVGVRTHEWKYTFHHAGGLRQLFDLRADPHELRNLCLGDAAPEHRRRAAELHRSLLDWNADQGFASRVENGDFKVLPPGPVWFDRNSQYDQWIDYLPDAERRGLWSEARAVYEAIKNERYTDPAELDLEFWEQHRTPGCIAELERLLGRRLR
jgi:hypothetical protein